MKAIDMTLIALMTALLIVATQLALPIGPVPFTLQTFIILLIGYLLSPRNAFLATFLYLIIGLIGLPVFSGFSGGLQSFLSPSFGFVLSFMPACYLQAKYIDSHAYLKLRHLITAGLLNTSVTYLIGLNYMTLILNGYMNNDFEFRSILMIGLIPFIAGDLLKIIVAITLTQRLRPIVLRRTKKVNLK